MKPRPRRYWATVSLLIGAFTLPPALSTPALAAETPGTVQLRDSRITESSALVDLGPWWVTTNDSGDSARLFMVSPSTGRTVGLVRYRASVVDVEALAPAGPSAVWVGDIGDNDNNRRSVSVYRVTVGPGRIDVTPRRYRLVYPNGSPNAEALFADRHGRLYVVSKGFGGGVVYRAPSRLSSTKVNRLEPLARVVEYATDAALTRDGRHVIVRGPVIAGVYTVPGFQRVGSFRLPLQPQGEGISVGPTGLVRVSSEGAHTAVRQVTLPTAVLREIDPSSAPAPTPAASESASPSPSPSPSATPTPDQAATTPSASHSSDDSSSNGIAAINPTWLMWCIPAVVALGALGIGLGLRRRTE